jgi:hypothetical protein
MLGHLLLQAAVVCTVWPHVVQCMEVQQLQAMQTSVPVGAEQTEAAGGARWHALALPQPYAPHDRPSGSSPFFQGW